MKKTKKTKAGVPLRDPEHGRFEALAYKEKAREAKKRSWSSENPGPRERRRCEIGTVQMLLPVAAVAKDERLAEVVRDYVGAHLDFPYPRKTKKGVRRRVKVRVEIRLTSYLTNRVPKRLRTRSFTVLRQGQILVHAARMYAAIFAADERLGGEGIEERTQRLERERAEDPKRLLLLNRTFGPYVWGHDLEDLVFEEILVRWTGPRSCVAYVHVGS